MKKEIIKNRKGQNVSVIVQELENQKGLAFVMHGLGGFKEQDHIRIMAEAFQEKGYTVIRFDTTNSLGESDGRIEDATVTNYYEDLEDVILWAKSHNWYQEPFCLAGHSIGGMCVCLYTEKHPEKVKALAPISTVISGKRKLETLPKKELEEWKKTGWRETESVSKAGAMKRLPWSHIQDRLKYDILEKVDRLTMPVLLIIGENDESVLPEHQKMLYEKLPGRKELYLIKKAPHAFREQVHLKEVKDIFLKWIDENLSNHG